MDYSVLSLPTATYQSNSYLVVNHQTKTALLIDPSVSLERLQEVLGKQELTLTAIFLTHCHIDHMFGLPAIQKEFCLPVYCHPLDQDGLSPNHPKSVCQLFGMSFEGADSLPLLKDGVIQIGEFEGKYYHTPGHTEGCVCYQFGNSFFSGDTILSGSIGRCDLPSGNPEKLLKSLQAVRKIFQEQINDGICYPGHGAPQTFAWELAQNPYLQ